MTDSALPPGLTHRQEAEMMGWLRDRQQAAQLANRFREHPTQAMLHGETVNLYDRLLAQFGVTRPDEAHAELTTRLRERETQQAIASTPIPSAPAAPATPPSGIARLLGVTTAAAAIFPPELRQPAPALAATAPAHVSPPALEDSPSVAAAQSTPLTQTAALSSAPSAPAIDAAIQRVRLGGLILRGNSGDDVQQMQNALIHALGNEWRDSKGRPLQADSRFGPQTEEAVRAFQRRRGLQPDGKIGQRTLTALGQALGYEDIPARIAPPGMAGRTQVSGGASVTEPDTPQAPAMAGYAGQRERQGASVPS